MSYLQSQKNILFLGFLVFACGCIFSHQQVFGATDTLPIPTEIDDLEEQVSTRITPKYPRPGEDVTITLEAYGTDLNAANIIWSVNDIIFKQGKGEKQFKINAGTSGQQTNVSVTIEPRNGKPIIKNFVINPQTVDILWEADTYTPPFYKGKSMFTPEDTITFVAMPNINNEQPDPKTLSYKWIENQEVQGSKSGYGQNTFKHTGGILMKPVEINVEASTEGGQKAFNTIFLRSIFPEVNLYEDHPLYGFLFNKEISGVFPFGEREEGTIAAFPFFLSTLNRITKSIVYNWTVNYNKVIGQSNKNELTLRNTENTEGKSYVSVEVRNSDIFLQKGETNTYVDFKKIKKIIGL